MKKLLLVALSLLMISTALPALALGPLDVDADLTFMSQYYWRGVVANPEAVLQPSASAGIMGIGLGFWGNMDMTDIGGKKGAFSEIDYIASYGLPLPMVDVDFGLIYYHFPDSDFPSTAEIYASGSMGILLSPTLSVYYDFKEADGSYIEGGISYPVALSPKLNLELGLSAGFGDSNFSNYYYGVKSTGLTNFLLTAAVPFDPIPFFTITPSVNFGSQMGDFKTATDAAQGDSDSFHFGLSASFSF